ncbi:unnamed protein product [Rotaria magnacalcarata]|uniref:Cation/H+ exchanger transmembrane domain-containing protein n=1 Tax=Rotaria magnacalcarata TaxID=392030 RepID=A0A815FD85_9BILA|nr:unnamed protein product [Rotaria magnacalcarata]CAF1621648.1 unnamed protein product [Rotaria magnacalcarata]CAF1991507.1 unnamed protein product [Rotaria magnacalcarata]CAF2012373.1 unnamed protein product [Rotaria magnacalcarata]CAF2118613.1 unnamed protein product [Rotaria magnacalcarata]
MVVLFDDPRGSPLATFLMQVFISLVVSKILAKLLSFIRQPQVIGQIIAGIIFGPSLLGSIPAWNNAIWPESSLGIFSLIANLGLIFFMFFLGLELDLHQIKKSWKITIPVAFASVVIPVGIGCAVSLWLYALNEGLPTSKAAFILFIGSGFGFSAFPVLATLLNTMGLLNKPIGVQTISLAAVEDIVVWVILAIASAFSLGGSALQGLYTLLLTLGFIAIMIFIIRPILNCFHGYYLRRENDTNIYLVVVCFLLLVVASFTTEVMGIHAFFGAFIAGLCIPRKGTLVEFLGVRIQLIIVEFFLPLYFTNSGLHTHLNLMNTGKAWWTLIVLLILASAAKIIPVTLVSKLCSKKPWRYCLSIGVLMNTRGIVQLVVLNIGVELGVLSPELFAIFVLMATILTFLTSPILSLLYRRKFDTQKSSNLKVPENLGNPTQTNVNVIETTINDSSTPGASNGDINNNSPAVNSSKLSRKSSTKVLPNYTFATLEYSINITDTNLDTDGEENIESEMLPSRSNNMTRF